MAQPSYPPSAMNNNNHGPHLTKSGEVRIKISFVEEMKIAAAQVLTLLEDVKSGKVSAHNGFSTINSCINSLEIKSRCEAAEMIVPLMHLCFNVRNEIVKHMS